MQRVGLVHAVLRQHFSDDGLRAVTDGQQEGLVRHIAAKALAVDLQGAAGVGAAVARPKLLQLLLQLLLPSPAHHGLRVGDGARERRLGQF